MHVTRDVILDLAPVYLTGDASADTRALVDEYLASDPELAKWMVEQRAEVFATIDDVPPVHLEMHALARTRRKVGLQRWLFGLACFFLALSLSIQYSTRNGRLVDIHLLARDYPMPAALCVALAIFCWFAYRTARRSAL
jgi:hypothetical protein